MVGPISKTRKNSVLKHDGLATINSFGREISLGTLRQQNQRMGLGMGNMDSNTSLTVRRLPSESRSAFNPKQFLNQSPSGTKLDFRQITKDQSVTKLDGVGFVSEMAISTDKLPTIAQALAGVPISPSNNTIGVLPT